VALKRGPTVPGTDRVTIHTVAADAGVSFAAVSKVLRNAYGVSDALREKVQTSIDRLGYRPNVAARAMRGHTYRVGVLLVEMANPFLPDVIAGINATLIPAGYQALIGVGQSRETLEVSLIESMIDSRMDGVILVAPHIPGDTLATLARQIPTVIIGQHEPTAKEFDSVNSDDRLGAALAVRALVERGHRDIGMLVPHSAQVKTRSVMHQRELGYRQAMTEAGLGAHIRSIYVPDRTPGDPPGQHEADIKRALAAPDRPSALFCWSDLDGVDVVIAARALGLKVPGDLSVIGYDNSRIAALGPIGLASIDQQGPRIGALAAETLLSRVHGRKTAEHLKVTPHLAVRGSL
jgi:LacI family transcriptional regulator